MHKWLLVFFTGLGFGWMLGQVPPAQLDAYQLGKSQFRKAEYTLAQQSFLVAQKGLPNCKSCDSLGVLAMIQSGRCLDRQSRFEEALVAYEKAVVKGWEMDNAKNATQARINQGFVLSKMGEMARAELTMREALIKRQEIFGEESKEYARCLSNLQAILSLRGKHQASVEVLEEAQEIYRNLELDQSLRMGHFLAQEANSRAQLANYPLAREKAFAALEIYEKKAKGVQYIPNVYGILSAIEEEAGNREQAMGYLEKADSIFVAHFGENRVRERGKMLAEMGRLQSNHGKHAQALSTYGKALIHLIEGYSPSKETDLPDWELFPDQDPYILIALEGKAKSLAMNPAFKAGDQEVMEASLGYLDLAFRLAGDLGDHLQNQSDREYLAKDIHSRMGTALAICLQADTLFPGKGYARQALHYMETAQSLALKLKLQDLAARRSLKTAPGILALEASLQDSLARAKALLALDSTKYQPYHLKRAAWDRKLDSLHQAYFPPIIAPWSDINLDSTQRYLKSEKSLLLEYFRTDSAYVAFAIFPDRIQTREIEARTLESKVAAFLIQLKRRQGEEGRADSLVQIGQELYQSLIAPFLIDSTPNTDQHLVIVPDGILSGLPFGALLTGDPDGYPMREWPFLIQKTHLHYAWSRSLIAGWEKNHESNGKALVLGLDFMETSSRKSNLGQRGDFMPLLFAQKEVEKIADLTGGELWLNDNSAEERFRKEARDYRILHLATHGEADLKHPELSALQLHASGEDDGYLYAFEISGLDLEAEMVVLSACETGKGEWKEGEGVMSLGRAFAYAGCPATVVSQWNVNDRSTQELMGQYYKHLVAGKRKSEALTLAKRYLIEKVEADPYYWAPFVLQGDDRPMPEIGGSNAFTREDMAILALVLVVAGGILVGVGWRRSKRQANASIS